ncbi:MAG: hypothetical protein HUU38_25185 [Anaerolineales bacterium]|nr:hypothetical protein [Anaerolineales bacterium]
MHTLIIVESPNKARAVAQYAREILPGPVTVRACLGHLRDLLEGALHVDVQNGFKPDYALLPNRIKTVATLRAVIRQADQVLLATDPDREGEAIAWHVTQIFQAELSGKAVKRVSFHSLTRQGVQNALQHPRALNMPLIQAAVARRVMDRLFGYVLSPILWRGVKGRDLSAGRVQTAALRLLVEFETVGESFPQPETWTVEVEL